MARAAIFRFKDQEFRALRIPEGMVIENNQSDWDMVGNVVYVHRFTYDEKTYVRVENTSVGEGLDGKALLFEFDGYVLEEVFDGRFTLERRRAQLSDFFSLGDKELMKDAENGDTITGTYRAIKGNTAYYHEIEFSFTGDLTPFILPFESNISGVPILTDYPNAQYIGPVDFKVLLGLSQNFFDHFAFLPVNDNEENARLIGDITLLIDYIQAIDKLNELYAEYGVDSLALNTNDWDLEVGVNPDFDDSEIYNEQLQAYERKLRHFAIAFNRLIDIQDGEIPIENLPLNEIYSIVSYLPSILLGQMSFENRMKLFDGMLKDSTITQNWNILFMLPVGVSLIPFTSYDPTDDEEGIFLKLIRSIDTNNLQETDDFLNKLLVISKNQGASNVTVFEDIYEKIDDPAFLGIGSKNKRQLINLIYSIWLNSSFNPYFNLGLNDPVVIPYTYKTEEEVEQSGGTLAPVILGFDEDTILQQSYFDYEFQGQQIQVKKSTQYISEAPLLDRVVYGTYEIFQPVSVQYLVNERDIKVPRLNGANNAFVPIFYMKYVDDFNEFETFKKNVGTLFDVALTFTGLGNFTKLRHLRALSKLTNIGDIAPTVRLLQIRELASTVEVFAGAASIIKSGFLDNTICNGDPNTSQFCQRLDYFLLLLELASLSGDIWTKRALKKSADDLLTTGIPNDFPVEGRQLILELGAEFSDIVATFNTKLNSQGFTNIVSQIDALPNTTLKIKFAKDLFFKSPQQVLKYYDEFPEAILYWSNLTDIGKDLVSANAELTIRYFRIRSLLKEGKFNEAAAIFNEKIPIQNPVFNSSGNRYLRFDDTDLKLGGEVTALKAIDDAEIIIARTDDVSILSNLTGLPESIVQVAKNHYFEREVLFFDKDQQLFFIGRFERGSSEIDNWNDAIDGFPNLTGQMRDDAIDEFTNFLAHEYVESKLMDAGLNFRSFVDGDNAFPHDFGAHVLSITPSNGYKVTLEFQQFPPAPLEDYSNLDEIVNFIKNIVQSP